MTLRLAVTSTAFSKNPDLRAALDRAGFSDVRLNDSGDRLARGELERFLSDRDAVILGLDRIDGPLLDRLPELRLVSKFGVGMDNVDVSACRVRGVTVGVTPGVNRRSVAEQALALMIMLSRNLFRTAESLRRGVWVKDGGSLLSGRTVGLIGLGHVGKDVARLLDAFGCRVLANDLLDQSDYLACHGLEAASKERIFAEAGIVSLHVPLTEATRAMIDRQVLAAMRPDAFLVNTARGELVVEADLIRALDRGAIAGAALDVYDAEPPSDPALLAHERMICTPHIAGNAREAVLAMGEAAIGHVKRFAARGPDSPLAGRPAPALLAAEVVHAR